MAASGGGTAPDPVSEAEAASEPTRDIRPRLVERAYIPRTRQPTRAMLAPPEPASASASVSAPPSKPVEKAVEPKPDKSTVKPMPGGLKKDIEKGQSVVALVGPPSANKADAEALLARLQSAVEGARGKSNTALQAAVFQTPEGWRAAVWPFASREEAQIINATLVARGMKTRAVDF
ncbi:MAG: SPOR domain-containing protein [Microbacteriaceae bacterium]|nr:SPOR domain-containing protein [Burkholderiaceae bacterium]